MRSFCALWLLTYDRAGIRRSRSNVVDLLLMGGVYWSSRTFRGGVISLGDVNRNPWRVSSSLAKSALLLEWTRVRFRWGIQLLGENTDIFLFGIKWTCGANGVMQSLALMGLLLVDNWCSTGRWEHSCREVGWFGGRVVISRVERQKSLENSDGLCSWQLRNKYLYCTVLPFYSLEKMPKRSIFVFQRVSEYLSLFLSTQTGHTFW